MGNAACRPFHRAPMPNPVNPNKNICTIYEKNADGSVAFDPNDATANSIIGDYGQPYTTAYYVPDDYCTPATSAIRSVIDDATEYCNNIGDDGEWEPVIGKNNLGEKSLVFATGSDGPLADAESSCYYNDCNARQRIKINGKIKADCCGSCCMIAGTTIGCQRKKFNADNVVCCFLDNECSQDNNIEDSCWQTTNKRKTCDPRYRNLKSSDCLETIKPYCTGDKLFAGQSHWMEAWLPNSSVDVNSGQTTATEEVLDGSNKRIMKQPCLRALARAVYSDSGGVCTWEQFQQLDIFQGTIDPSGLAWAQDVLNSIMDKYIKEFGSPFGEIDQDGYIKNSDFLDFYWSLCDRFPAICKNSLTNFCNKFTPEILIERPEAFKWCGCYLPDEYYQEYTQYGIQRECTPYCNIKGNIPSVAEDFTKKVCTQTICIIDDITIKIAESIYPDGINFSQLCRSCGQSEISKIYEGVDNNISNNTIGKINYIFIPLGLVQSFTYNSNPKYVYPFWYTSQKVTGDLKVILTQIGNNGNPIKDDNNNPIVTLNYQQETVNQNGDNKIEFIITGIKSIIRDGSKISSNSEPVQVYIDRYIDDNNNPVYFNSDKTPLYTTSYLIDSNISINEKQNIINKVREDNIQVSSNTCSCIIRNSTIDIENSRFNSLNISQNCGASQCFNTKGETISCGSTSETSQIINDVENSINNFINNIEKDKIELSALVSFGILLLLIFVWWTIMLKSKKN
jgi:hypothetical protein